MVLGIFCIQVYKEKKFLKRKIILLRQGNGLFSLRDRLKDRPLLIQSSQLMLCLLRSCYRKLLCSIYLLFFMPCILTRQHSMIKRLPRPASFLLLLLFLFLLLGCSSDEREDIVIQEVVGREGRFNAPTWRVRRPSYWIAIERTGPEHDTTLPVQEWAIGEGDELIRVQIHSFPAVTLKARIPPMAQITRWQRQFSPLPPPDIELTRQAFSGYAGYLMDGRGTMKGSKVRSLAFAMSLPERSYAALSALKGKKSSEITEMQSDITIKVIGSEEAVDQKEKEIRSFARSFELIDPIP